ncbi:unnamed protein product [Parajaminaea phylloscopi]
MKGPVTPTQLTPGCPEGGSHERLRRYAPSLPSLDTLMTSEAPLGAAGPALGSAETLSNHCSFVLLAEFDIDRGSTLSNIWPDGGVVEGHDHHTLAELMLPDGAHARSEDWTVFLLPPGQSNRNGNRGDAGSSSLTYVLNLVRTKHDASVRRGALVKAMAIGTHHPCIRVFKPILLLALDEYFQSPGTEALEKLYAAINRIDLSAAPTFSRAEKSILRATERRDLFLSRFHSSQSDVSPSSAGLAASASSTVRLDSRPPAQSQGMSRKPSSASAKAKSAFGRGVSAENNSAPIPDRPATGPPVEASHRDTHVWETTAQFGRMDIPIRWPLDEWPEEIGEYSLSSLFQTFGSQPVTGPLHAHLHSNGSLTHPIVLLFNAIVTYKRVIFLGHNLPAATVASHVLAAAALGSGCGSVFPGIQERISPYANLISLSTLETTPGFIAGVTNPRFEELKCWDVLCNVETGKITVSKLIEPAAPANLSLGAAAPTTWSSIGFGSINGSVGLSNDGNTSITSIESSDLSSQTRASPDAVSSASTFRSKGSLPGSSAFRGHRSVASSVSEFGTLSAGVGDSRQDSVDTLYIEEIIGCISARYSESYVRARISEYAANFGRNVVRHDEQCHGGAPLPELRRFPHQPYLNGQIGSGTSFGDREGEHRDLAANAGRTEGFRATPGYKKWLDAAAQRQSQESIVNVDAWHQVSRLRGRGKAMSGSEASLIFSTLNKNVKSEEQIVELLALLPLYMGGLLPLASGLFHPSARTRATAVELLTRIASHRDAGVKYIQSLPLYHRLAFARLQREVILAHRSRDAGAHTASDATSAAPQLQRQEAGAVSHQTGSMAPQTSAAARGAQSPASDASPAHDAQSGSNSEGLPPRELRSMIRGFSDSGSDPDGSVSAPSHLWQAANASASSHSTKNSSLSAAFKELNLTTESPITQHSIGAQDPGRIEEVEAVEEGDGYSEGK